MITRTLTLFADYYQFYLQDESVSGDLGKSWTKEATARMLAVGDGAVGVGTVRNTNVPVTIVVAERAPPVENGDWDKVNECVIEIESGRLVVAGCTDYFPDAERIALEPGSYRVRVYYGGLRTISDDGLEGGDHYKVVLWKVRAANETES